MLLQRFIERYKKARKQEYLNLPSNYRYRYAFIGAGQHSFSNLYPVLHHLGVPLSTVCTLHRDHAEKMATRFKDCIGTDQLQEILNNDSVKGVFVSANPNQHFQLVQQLLSAGKTVFVEKPPCYSLQELEQLVQHPRSGYCLPGLQKRFSTINQLLQRYTGSAIDYSYRYFTGAYPEGDALAELFIHPIDNAVYLFGEIKKAYIQPSLKNRNNYVLSVVHASNTTGVIHLSIDHSWKIPVDELLINAGGEILQATYPNRLVSTSKSPVYLNVPLEKISKRPVTQHVLLDNNHFVPTVPNNNIATQGFLGEISYFLQVTEKDETFTRHHLRSLLPTYTIIEKMRLQG